MSITQKLNDKTLKVNVDGRIDNTTASKFESDIKSSLNDADDIEFDFKNLDYISSAGLRVILSIKKSIKGNLTIFNMNKGVREVFDVTGFSSIITIK